jgi:hypothetical protein
MEIRFCDRCHESIPDAEFDAGRAVTLKGRTLHVACALGRALSAGGPRAWLGFLLALFAAGAAAFLLVRELGRADRKDEVPEAVLAKIGEAAKAVETRAAERMDELAARTRADVQSIVETSLRGQREQLTQDLSRLASLPAELAKDREASVHRWGVIEGRLGALETRMKEMSGWIQDLKDRAKAAVEPTPPAPSPSPPPEPAAAPPAPGPDVPEDPAIARERAAEVDRWIERLRDPNDGIAFSATLRLAELKDLRAVPPLADVLRGHKDFYVRLGAATSLGDLKSADAVPDLMEALDDKDDLVRIQANQSLQAITGHEESFPSNLQKPERRKVMLRWKAWWKENEDTLRARLGQPRASR